MLRRLIGSIVALVALGFAPVVATAQDLPTYASPDVPRETIRGRIIGVDGPFRLTLRDVRGFVDTVELRGSTVVNPAGLVLEPGMDVTIVGSNGGAVFVADEVDTPFTYDGDPPAPVYYGDGWWYPGYGYGYGPSFSLGFAFGTPYLVPRPFVGHPISGGGYGHWHGARRPLAVAPTAGIATAAAAPAGATAPATRRVYGAASVPSTHMDQVTTANQHHAEPAVYTVTNGSKH